MKTATRLNDNLQDLQVLGRYLHQRLHSEVPQLVPFRVQCILKQEVLMILVQHRADADIVPSPQQLIVVVAQAISASQPEFPFPVKLYVRVQGTQQPYTCHNFSVKKRQGDTVDGTPSEQPKSELPGETPPLKSGSWFPLLPGMLLVLGTGISLGVSFCGLYGLTYPCAIGECKAMSDAKLLSKNLASPQLQPTSAREMLKTQQQLKETIDFLKTIPWWSKEYKNAQELIKTYQKQATRLEGVVNAMKKAYIASQKSQNPPHSASDWVEIQKLWQEAIAQLEQIPNDSNVYPLVQQRLRTYKLNLAIVHQRLAASQQAQKH